MGVHPDGFPRLTPPRGKPLILLAWAIDTFRSGWEWYAFDVVQKNDKDTIYYGFVRGQVDEFGTFSRKELEDLGITVYDDPKHLEEVAPPPGWTKG